jgi:hypothetical protein
MKMSKVCQVGHSITLCIQLEIIHPNQDLSLEGLLSIKHSTLSKRHVQFTTEDGVNASAEVFLQVGYPVDIVVFQRNQASVSRRISISILDTAKKTPIEFFQEINKSLSQNKRDSIAAMRFLSRIKQFVSGKNGISSVVLPLAQ